jgi:hypothetical protein
MTIFGISFLDFYGITFIASFFTEISFILGNIVNYLTGTHFYSVISGLFGTKVEIDKPTNVMRPINQNSTRSESHSKVSD